VAAVAAAAAAEISKRKERIKAFFSPSYPSFPIEQFIIS